MVIKEYYEPKLLEVYVVRNDGKLKHVFFLIKKAIETLFKKE